MRGVHVHFYRPGEGDRWLNHVVTRFDPPYSHCDLQFDDNMATSIYQGEPVYWESKTFSRLNYDRVSLSLSDAEYERVRAYCTDAHRRQVGFDLLGMALTAMPRSIATMRRPDTHTFCSRYILEALQQSFRRELLCHDPCAITPSGLHRALEKLHNQFIHIPSKRILCMELPPSTSSMGGGAAHHHPPDTNPPPPPSHHSFR